MNSGPITLAIIGAGNRGRDTYGRWCLRHPEQADVVAVADTNAIRRAAMAAAHGIGPDGTFGDWRDLLSRGRLADAVVIATPDREHAAPSIAALEAGYSVILEKPIAPTPDEVRAVGEAAARSTGSVTVAHVLRYTPFFSAAKRLLSEGQIGELVTIEHAERIGYWHFAHSFVRGNWRKEALSSPMILAKACHDLDLIRWLAGDRCTAVTSFGGLRHFRREQAPPGAMDRCTDGVNRCPAAPTCPFDAVRFYVDRMEGVTDWPVSVITDDPSRDGRLRAVESGPYGRCVYHADNDVADHQVVALEFANGVHGSLVVSGLTADNTRTIMLSGTRGELRGRLDTGEIEIRRFLPSAGHGEDERMVVNVASEAIVDGHGHGHDGGDDALMTDAIARLRARRDGVPGAADEARTSLAASLESHAMAFAAETSRRERRLVELAG